MTTQMTVLGLGQVGASIGLALASQKEMLVRTGSDRELSVARQAEKMGAFDKVKLNLHEAVENADMVVLALPVDEIEETLKVIADDLKPGAVVIDTSPVRVALSETAIGLLGRDRYFVSMTASINPAYLEETAAGVEAAHADLFKDTTMVITSPPGMPAGAIDLAADLANLLGGKPFFADPLEADGLMAATHTLPSLLAAALVHATMDQPGWREARKLAGKEYAQGTLPASATPERKRLGQAALLNRENVVRVLDNLIASLREVRGMIDRQEGEALSQYLGQAQESRERWLKQRFSARWDDGLPGAPATVKSGDLLGRLIGLRPKKDKDQKS